MHTQTFKTTTGYNILNGASDSPERERENTVWGVDYRRIRQPGHEKGARWMSVLTRLNDGRLLYTWYSQRRPETEEMRQLLGRGLAKSDYLPEALWCDSYLSRYAGPWAEHYGLRLHVRCFPPARTGQWYDMRLERAMRADDAESPVMRRAAERETAWAAREALWEAEMRGILNEALRKVNLPEQGDVLTQDEDREWNLNAPEGWRERLWQRLERLGSKWSKEAI